MSIPTIVQERDCDQSNLLKEAVNLGREQDEEGNAGWLSAYAEPDQLRKPARQLRDEIHNLHATVSGTEQQRLQSMEEQCCNESRGVIEAGALRYCKDGKKNKYLRKVSEASDEFCEIAMHYQNVFDVLSNTGDYTSAIWAAVKLLMIYRVNDSELRFQVARHLGNIGELLTELSTFSYAPKTRHMQKAITKTYKLILQFLTQALQYYKENKLTRAFKNISQPWARRFQPIVSEVQASIQSVHRVIQVNVYAAMHQLNEGAMKIEDAVERGTQDLASKVEEGNLLILKGHIDLLAQFQALLHSPALLQDRGCPTIELWDERAKGQLLKEHGRHTVDEDTLLITDIDASEIPTIFEELFPQLSVARETDVARQKRYRPGLISAYEEDSHSVLNFQWNLTKRPETSQWAAEPKSHFLWIECYQESTVFDWTTRVSMDVQRLAISTRNGVVLSFFAGEKSLNITLSLVLQAFIQQLVIQLWPDFSSARCYKQAFTLDRLRDRGDDFIKLWSLFATCMDISQVDCVFVVLDNIDGLLNKCKDDEIQQFVCFLEGLSQSKRPICKILATSRINNLLPALAGAPSQICSVFPPNHISLLQIPRRPQFGSSSVQQRPRHRLSIVEETSGPIEDPMLAELWAEDERREVSLVTADNVDDDIIDALFEDETPKSTTTSKKKAPVFLSLGAPSDRASAKHGSDTDLSDLFDSDSEFDFEIEKSRLAEIKKVQKQPPGNAILSDDELLQDIFASSESDLDLSDLEFERKTAGSVRTENAQVPANRIVDDSEDDLDYDNL